MSHFIDLLIADNDLILDPSKQPLLINNRASVAQNIAHMIRDSGLLVTLVAERDRLRQRDCIQQIELKIEADERLIPGTVHIDHHAPGSYRLTATTLQFGTLEILL